jgi:hypothetical protein
MSRLPLSIPAAALVAAFAIGAGACTTGSTTNGSTDYAACVAAFRNAEPRAGAPVQVSPLDDAIRTCRTIADWRAAWEQVPAAHPTGNDPLAYLEQRCSVEALAPTVLCREAFPG